MEKKPLSERLKPFETMWTTKRDHYVLIPGEGGYSPIDVSGKDPMAVLIDEDDELAQAVAERMLAAGVSVQA